MTDSDNKDDKEGRGLGEAFRKVFTAGVGAAFLTEEMIRGYLAEVKLPKEILNNLLQNAARSKEQLMDRAGNEIATLIRKIDIVKEASRFAETHKFKITAEIEITKKE